jgi:glycerophosphoryl diester phosphodiesterase
MATIKRAYDNYTDGVEFDIFISRDGEIFVYHPEKD